jgi:acyl-CoA thioesterase-1
VALLALGVWWFFWSGPRLDLRRVANLDAPGEVVVFFGDSITQGYGIRAEESFPSLVAGALGVPFVNAGVPGDTMSAGLLRLERDVLPHRPRLVVVEFGGNDFLRRVPIEETLKSLETIVGRLTAEGILVVLAHVAVGLGGDPYRAGFEAAATRHGAVLIPDILQGILTTPGLKVDSIHPNAKGHQLVAERVLRILRPVLQEADRLRGRARGAAQGLPHPSPFSRQARQARQDRRGSSSENQGSDGAVSARTHLVPRLKPDISRQDRKGRQGLHGPDLPRGTTGPEGFLIGPGQHLVLLGALGVLARELQRLGSMLLAFASLAPLGTTSEPGQPCRMKGGSRVMAR